MSAVTFAFIALLCYVVGIATGALCSGDFKAIGRRILARARRLHGVRRLRKPPPLRKHTGHHRAGAAPVVALPPGQVIVHADKMHELTSPYLPELPRGTHPYLTAEEWRRHVNAGRAVEPVRTEQHPPWTGSQQALTPEVEAQMRGEYLASYLTEQEGMTDEQVQQAMRDAMTSLRQPSVTESVTAWRPEDVTHGQAPVADVYGRESTASEALDAMQEDLARGLLT